MTGRMAHLPFGEDFGESGSQEKHHFTSYERDGESGSDYAVNRQYNQAIGRFNRVDPQSSSAKKTAPQSWNRYSYGRNEPADQTDPLGLFAQNPDDCPAWAENCDAIGEEFDNFYVVDVSEEPGNEETEPPLPKWWTGFSRGEMGTINQALEAAFGLLTHSDCSRGLSSRQFNGKTIDVVELMRRILLLQVKPESEDPTTHGSFKIFNGQTSEHPGIIAERIRGEVVARF